MTFTFAAAGNSISALCSVLAIKKRVTKINLSLYNVYRHNHISIVKRDGQGVGSINITSSLLGNKCHLSKLTAAGVADNAAPFL